MNAAEVISMFRSAKWLGRHGDIVLVQDDRAELAGVDLKGVIAGGSATGHTHRFLGGGRVFGEPGSPLRVIDAVEGGVVDHEEHTTRPIPIGRTRTGIQQQFNESWGRVED
jgi:hypothetical protein